MFGAPSGYAALTNPGDPIRRGCFTPERRVWILATALLCAALLAGAQSTAPVNPPAASQPESRPSGESSQEDKPSEEGQGESSEEEKAPAFKDEDGLVAVNLRNAKIEQIVKFISDNTGKPVLMQEGLGGSINVIAPMPLRVEEALDIVYEALLLHDIVVIETSKRIAIIKADKAATLPLPLESGDTDGGSTQIMKMIPLENIGPEEAMAFLTPMVEHEEGIKPVPQAGAIMIKGTRNEVARIESLLDEADQPDAARLEIRMFALKSADASDIASQVRSLLSAVFEAAPQEGARRQEQSGHRILPDEANRRLIVAATPAVLEYAGQLIEQLDQPDAQQFVVNSIEVASADPQSISSLVGEIYRQLGQTDADRRSVRVFTQGNTLFVVSTEEQFEEVKDLVQRLDTADPLMELRIFPLEHAQAQQIQRVVQDILRTGAFAYGDSESPGAVQEEGPATGDDLRALLLARLLGGSGRRGQPQPAVLSDERLNALVVIAYPEQLDQLALVLEEIDVADPGDLAVRVIDTSRGDADQIVRALSNMYYNISRARGSRTPVQFSASADRKKLVILSNEEDFEQIKDLVAQLSGGKDVELRTVPVKFADPQLLADGVTLINAAMGQTSSSVVIAPHLDGKSLLVLASDEDFAFIEGLVEELDSQQDTTLRIFKLENAEAQDLEGMIESAIAAGYSTAGGQSVRRTTSRGRQGTAGVEVYADQRTNSLVVVGTPDDIEVVADLIEKMDQEVPMDLAVRLIETPQMDANLIVRSLTSVYYNLARASGSNTPVQFSASADGKQLIVLSSEADFARIRQLVGQMQGGEDVALHTVPVKFSDTQLLAEGVTLINAGLGQTSSAVAITPHLDGKSLLVLASDEDFAFIKGLIEELDSQQDTTLRVFELQNADAADLEGMIESAIAAGYSTAGGQSVRRTTSRGRQSTAGVAVYADQRTNSLVVVGTPDDIEVVADLIEKMDQDVPSDLAVRNIDLTYTRAAEIQPALQSVFRRLPRESDRDMVEITATRDDKRLLVLSSEENFRTILDLVAELDSREEADLTVIPLEYADASDLAAVLGNMLRSARSSSTGRSTMNQVYTVYGETGGLFTTKSDVTIIAETRINALLVAAAPEDLEVIRDLVEKLDRPREEQLSMHIMQLNFADASSVATAATEFFQPRSRSPRDEVKILANVYDNSIMVFASEENWLRIQKFVQEMDVEDVGKRGTKTYELKYIDATRLATQLEDLYAEQQPSSYWDYYYGYTSSSQVNDAKINFVPSPIGNQLMVVAPPQEISKIDELVAQLDSPAALEGVKPRIYYIRHTDATQMRDILTELFEGSAETTTGSYYYYYFRSQQSSRSTAGTSLGEVSFVVDRDANALIAFSANPANLDIVDELINQLDVLAPESTNTETVQLQYADAYDMAILLNSLYGGTLPRQQQNNQPNQQQQQRNEDYSTLSPTRTLERKPEYRDLYFWWQSSNERQNEEARPISTLIEQVRIVPDLRTNSLLVTAAPHHLQPLKALIAYLDRPEPQVLIKTRIVEIVQRGEKRTGVRWTPDPSNIRPEELDNAVTALGSLNLIDSFGGDRISSSLETGTSIGGDSINRSWDDSRQHIVGADINLTLLIQLLLRNSDSRELSKPTLTVDNNETGTIFVGADVPFITESQINTNGARNDSYDYREVGTRLDITPHINSKGQVVMEIDLGSSNIREGATLLGGAILDRRTYSTQIALEDRQTLVLGGILGQTDRMSQRKAPILGDIPLIKHFFRKTERLNETTELVAFVTPQVLWSRSDADEATNQMIALTDPENRDFYPAISPPTPAQQRDMQQMDARRREAAEARAVDRMRSWEYSVAKIRQAPLDRLDRAYEVLRYDQDGMAVESEAIGQIPPPEPLGAVPARSEEKTSGDAGAMGAGLSEEQLSGMLQQAVPPRSSETSDASPGRLNAEPGAVLESLDAIRPLGAIPE